MVYDREEGVRFPSLVRESSREELSVMSSPTVMEDIRDTSVSTGTPMREIHPHRTATGAILERKIVELERRNAELAMKLRRMEDDVKTGDTNGKVANTASEIEATLKESEMAIREYESVNRQLSERVASLEEELHRNHKAAEEIKQLQHVLTAALDRHP